MLWFEQPKCSHCLSMMGTSNKAAFPAAILNLHERIENKLFLDRTRKDSNFKRPHISATLFQIEKCWEVPLKPVAGQSHMKNPVGGSPQRNPFYEQRNALTLVPLRSGTL